MFRDGRIGGGDLPTVGIWASNVPEWQVIDFSLHLYGLVNVALYESLGPDAVGALQSVRPPHNSPS